jgi:hypothetical protein
MYGVSDFSREVFPIDLATGQGGAAAGFTGGTLLGAFGASFFGEAVATTPTTSPTTTTTLPGLRGGEICGNCVDDDGDGRTDFEDPACCDATGVLNLRRGLLQPKGATGRLELSTQIVSGPVTAVDPLVHDLHVQLRLQGGSEMLCAKVPATSFRKKRKIFQFRDRKHTVPSAAGVDGVVVRLLRKKKLRWR